MNPLRRVTRGRRLVAALGIAAFGSVVLAACSSPTNHSHNSTTTTTTTTTIPGRSTTSTTTSAVPTTCSTGVLGLSAAAGGTAAGTAYSIFTLANRGPSACSLEGYPSLSFFSPSGAGGSGAGQKLSIAVVDAGPSPEPVTLHAGGSAEFILVYHDIPVGGVGCSTVGSVDVSLPDSTEVLSTPVSITACGGTANVYAFGPPGSESP